MGTAAPALVVAALFVAADARAESCTGVTAAGGRFAKCFDLGNRLSVTAGSDGFGGSVKLRHMIRFDDEPDLVWKLEHTITDATWGAWHQQLDGALYRGRFLRHARDGHIVLPFGIPKKVFLPFDIGAEAAVATVRWRPLAAPEDELHLGVIKIASLMDFARTRGSHRRFAIGPVVSWDIDVDRSMGRIGKVSEHAVAPFTMGMLNLHFESKEGLWVGDVRAEAGTAWHTQGGWKPQAEAEATLERIVLAINDRPIAITAGVSYATLTEEAIARVGARVVLVHRNDKRVNLRPLADRRAAPKAAPPTSASPAPAAAPPPAAKSRPAESPPAQSPPAESPPAESPPAESPPAESPPAESPPAESPPAESPPSPPAEAPPSPAGSSRETPPDNSHSDGGGGDGDASDESARFVVPHAWQI